MGMVFRNNKAEFYHHPFVLAPGELPFDLIR
jgi:hypothetical protein